MAKTDLQKESEMTGKSRYARFSFVVLFAVQFVSLGAVEAQYSETTHPYVPQSNRVALLSDPFEWSEPTPAAPAKSAEPIPFKLSTMAGDLVPPFVANPELSPVKKVKTEKATLSFDENMPVEPRKTESIDDCCRELTAMIAGNLDSDISIDAKTRMIETALKMVARNVALKAEAKITKLKADHALEMARIQSQMGQMRSTRSSVDQINRVAGPLSHILQRNYQQAVTMNLANEQLSQTLGQLGYKRLEEEAAIARANRQRIQLSTPPSKEDNFQLEIARLTDQVARQQKQLDAQRAEQTQRPRRSNILPAGYNQPLQPRRQPLEPLPEYQSNEFYSASPTQWRSR